MHLHPVRCFASNAFSTAASACIDNLCQLPTTFLLKRRKLSVSHHENGEMRPAVSFCSFSCVCAESAINMNYESEGGKLNELGPNLLLYYTREEKERHDDEH